MTLLLALLLAASEPPGAQLFADGNAAYLEGDLARAVAAYEALASEGVLSPQLETNLAAAYLRQGKRGLCALHLERALFLDSGDDDARADLLEVRRGNVDKLEGGLEESGADALAALLAPLPGGRLISFQDLEVLKATPDDEMYVFKVDLHQAEQISHVIQEAPDSFTMVLRPDEDNRPVDESQYGTTTDRLIMTYLYPAPQLIDLNQLTGPSPYPYPGAPNGSFAPGGAGSGEPGASPGPSTSPGPGESPSPDQSPGASAEPSPTP